jgi:hypothetical protein
LISVTDVFSVFTIAVNVDAKIIKLAILILSWDFTVEI